VTIKNTIKAAKRASVNRNDLRIVIAQNSAAYCPYGSPAKSRMLFAGKLFLEFVTITMTKNGAVMRVSVKIGVYIIRLSAAYNWAQNPMFGPSPPGHSLA